MCQGWRKQFYFGQANSGHYSFEHVGKRAAHSLRVCIRSYSVKHNQHAKKVNYYRGSVACCPGKFGKTDVLRLNLGAFQGFS